MSFYKYTDRYDRIIVLAIIERVLSDGNTISVNDGEEWTLRCSNSKADIIDALATTGEDHLKIRDDSGQPLGTLYFIYCNGNEGRDVLCDYGYTIASQDYMEELVYLDNID